MTNGPRKPKKGSYTNTARRHERPDFYPFPTPNEALEFAAKAGFGYTLFTLDGPPCIATRTDQRERKFQLKRVLVDSTIIKGEKVPMWAWFEMKRGRQ